MAKEVLQNLEVNEIKKTKIVAELIGTGDLILNKKCRSYEMSEVWKQANPKGSEMPAHLNQGYNLWERLITSIHWRDSIEFHDDDWSKYTEDEWKEYMTNNAPCFKSYALIKSMSEAFKTFGYKDSTGKAGTDFMRSVSLLSDRYPIEFAKASYEQKLVPNNSQNKTNVVCQYNVFSGWRSTVEIICADIVLPAETVLAVLRTTGEFIGIGTQRKNGFGHFDIGKVELVSL